MTQTNEQLAEAIAGLLDIQKSKVKESLSDTVVGSTSGYVVRPSTSVYELAHRCHVALCEKYGSALVGHYPDSISYDYLQDYDEERHEILLSGYGKTHHEAIFDAVLNHSKGVA